MRDIKLFLFPFAGGSSYSFKALQQLLLNHGITSKTLELPGRGYRTGEQLISDINLLADDLFQLIGEELHQPYAFYGHSMGTILAYLVAIRARKNGLPTPQYLFLTGHEGPSICKNRAPSHRLSKEDFINKLRLLGGSPLEILKDEELLNYFEPIIRSDFKAVETYQHVANETLNTPMTICIGSKEDIEFEEAQAWSLETSREVEVLVFPGGHFFIHQHEYRIAEIISKRLQ